MPSFATLTLADGQTTPVNHTFTPVSLQSGLGVWNDRSKSVLLEQPYVTAKTTKSANSTGLLRQQFTINVPLYSAVDGKQLNNVGATIEVRIPANSTQAQRDDIAAYVKNFAASTVFAAMVKNGEGLFA